MSYSNETLFFVLLLLAHIQAVLIPAWIARRIKIRQSKLRIVLPDGGISLLRFGFACFSIAALAEMLDHTETSWIYINRISGWNGLFYAGLAGGLASLTAAVTENKKLRILLYVIVIEFRERRHNLSSINHYSHFSCSMVETFSRPTPLGLPNLRRRAYNSFRGDAQRKWRPDMACIHRPCRIHQPDNDLDPSESRQKSKKTPNQRNIQ